MTIISIPRTVWTSPDVTALPRDQRLILLGLWSMTDQAGLVLDDARMIAATLLPCDSRAGAVRLVERTLTALTDAGVCRRYTAPGGVRVLQVLRVAGVTALPAWDESCAETVVEPVASAGSARSSVTPAEPTSAPSPALPMGIPDSEAGEVAASAVSPAAPAPEVAAPTGEVAAASVAPAVERVCQHMAESVRERTGRTPRITKAWRDSARLMMDRDGRTEEDIIAATDWSAADDFWRSNILSMPTLRKQFDRLSLQAQRGGNRTHRAPEDPIVTEEEMRAVMSIYSESEWDRWVRSQEDTGQEAPADPALDGAWGDAPSIEAAPVSPVSAPSPAPVAAPVSSPSPAAWEEPAVPSPAPAVGPAGGPDDAEWQAMLAAASAQSPDPVTTTVIGRGYRDTPAEARDSWRAVAQRWAR